jgi:CRISPR-associated protein Cas2
MEPKSSKQSTSKVTIPLQPAQDDIRCYRLPERADIKTLGRQFFPEDVMLFTGGINRLFSGQ